MNDKLRGRYWIFEFDDYYPNGGMNDLRYSVDDLKDLLERIGDKRQILDTKTGEFVEGKIENFSVQRGG